MRQGRKIFSPNFVAYALVSDGSQARSRLGFSISGARVPLATRRNRLRRISIELWKKRVVATNSKGIDCVLIVRKTMGNRTRKGINEEIGHIFDRILS
ncbi:MAG: ribonuclease P protein component [Candidatus Omnitrophota bacterium]